MCISFICEEMVTENREFYFFEPGINLDILLAKTVNVLSTPGIDGIQYFKGTLIFEDFDRGVDICRPHPTHYTLLRL